MHACFIHEALDPSSELQCMKMTIYAVNFNQFAILTNLKCLKLDILAKENRYLRSMSVTIYNWLNWELEVIGRNDQYTH